VLRHWQKSGKSIHKSRKLLLVGDHHIPFEAMSTSEEEKRNEDISGNIY
jgi:hypothetical protein